MNSLCTIILVNFSSLPRTFCATHLYFPASTSCTPAIFITPLDNTFVRLLGNVSLIRDQTKVGAGFPDVEHGKTAASLSFTLSCEEETVTFGAEMDSPGSPFIPGIPGAQISPFTPFSPFIPGGPIIPCFPLLPGCPIIPFLPLLPRSPLLPLDPSLPGIKSRQSMRVGVQVSSISTKFLEARSNNIFQNKSYFRRIFKRFITGDLSGKLWRTILLLSSFYIKSFMVTFPKRVGTSESISTNVSLTLHYFLRIFEILHMRGYPKKYQIPRSIYN